MVNAQKHQPNKVMQHIDRHDKLVKKCSGQNSKLNTIKEASEKSEENSIASKYIDRQQAYKIPSGASFKSHQKQSEHSQASKSDRSLPKSD